jgi:hypothetical protein
MQHRLYVIAALAIIIGAVGAAEAATNVKVRNKANDPVPVVDQTVLQPVQGNVRVRLLAGERSTTLDLITPPDGKMVVIEYLTIRVFAREETANALLDLTGSLGAAGGVRHFLEAFPPPINVNVVSAFQQMLTQHVLLYSTGPVRLNIDRGQKDTVVADFDVSFSGYLVDAPKDLE